jgi:hypothetical protein
MTKENIKIINLNIQYLMFLVDFWAHELTNDYFINANR